MVVHGRTLIPIELMYGGAISVFLFGTFTIMGANGHIYGGGDEVTYDFQGGEVEVAAATRRLYYPDLFNWETHRRIDVTYSPSEGEKSSLSTILESTGETFEEKNIDADPALEGVITTSEGQVAAIIDDGRVYSPKEYIHR